MDVYIAGIRHKKTYSLRVKILDQGWINMEDHYLVEDDHQDHQRKVAPVVMLQVLL